MIPIGFETVTVTTADGKKVRGLRKNEDTFSVQLMTPAEELLSFAKPAATVDPEPLALVDAGLRADRLSDTDLADIVRYLRSLRGTIP